MADVYVVLAHIGSGEIVGAYSTLTLAQAAVSANPGCSYRIATCTIDGDVGYTLSQRSLAGTSRTASTLSPLPKHDGIRDGKRDA